MKFIVAVLFISIFNVAQSENNSVDTYIRIGDSGTLTIEKRDSRMQLFSLGSIGGNCHTCEVAGTITKNVGTADDDALDGKKPRCLISFYQRGDIFTVEPITPEPCRNYCGMRASFEGTYKKPPKGCVTEARRKRYETANKQYKSKEFSKSENTLKALTAECGEFMSEIETDRIRNDLALSQLHQGSPKNCLTTLGTTIAANYKDEERLKEAMPPCDFDNYISVASSTWFNQALCRKRLVK